MKAGDKERKRAEQAGAAQPSRRAGAGPLGGVIELQSGIEAKGDIERETE